MNYKRIFLLLGIVYIILSPILIIITANNFYNDGVWDGIYLVNKNHELDQSKLDAINKQNTELELLRASTKEYDKGFIAAMESIRSNILFAGSTFKYGNYSIKAWDILPGKVEIEVIKDGNYIFNGTCYADTWCNIKDVSFQIDDIHIGKEASYLVYWSNN